MTQVSGNPAFGDVLDAGTAFLRAAWEADWRSGATTLGWTAWARAAGVIVNTKPTSAWDEMRCPCRGRREGQPGHQCATRGAVPLSSVMATEGGSVAGVVYEPPMRPLVPLAPGEARRRPLRRRHRRRPPAAAL